MLTGMQAVAMEERSQHRNRKLALARLVARLAEMDLKRLGEAKGRDGGRIWSWRGGIQCGCFGRRVGKGA